MSSLSRRPAGLHLFPVLRPVPPQPPHPHHPAPQQTSYQTCWNSLISHARVAKGGGGAALRVGGPEVVESGPGGGTGRPPPRLDFRESSSSSILVHEPRGRPRSLLDEASGLHVQLHPPPLLMTG
ncbi:unnamed protein product [Pleuronectes platessa]|uniref:Uncharacterized protein n=1 Tax=Pleuronectes platessa TaxID=8262 RepID=A0A9N7W321_PLEPL|nr:unnamed protein product [Pleuronectes platessa]